MTGRLNRACWMTWLPLLTLLIMALASIFVRYRDDLILQYQVRSYQNQITEQQKQTGKEILPICETNSSPPQSRRCYENYLSDLLKVEGSAKALFQLKKLEEDSQLVRQYCHEIAHTLGHVAFQRYRIISEALKKGDHTCFSGYYHGVLESALAESSNIQETVRSACSAEAWTPFQLTQCLHGVGHGVTAYRHHNITKALADCDSLINSWQQEVCYNGAFMEMISKDFAHQVKITDPEAPQDDGTDFWPCLTVEERYRDQCFRYATSRLIFILGKSFFEAYRACEKLAEPTSRRACFNSYGRDVAYEGIRYDLSQIHLYCRVADGEGREECYRSAAIILVTHYADTAQAEKICNGAGINAGACAEGILQVKRSMYR